MLFLKPHAYYSVESSSFCNIAENGDIAPTS